MRDPGWSEPRLRALEAGLRALVEDTPASEPRVIPVGRPDVLADCFPEQLAFIRDRAPLKWAFCTRRAAKSFSVALAMIDDALDNPRAHYLILGMTRPEIKDIYWDLILKAINDKYNLGARFNESELTMRLPNGSLIRLAGADANEKEKKKFLGGKKRMVAIDEAQGWGTDLREMVFGVLKPSVADYNGQVICVGTPGNLTAGFFHQLTAGCKAGKLGPPSMREAGWSGHTWTTFRNTSVVDGKPMHVRWQEEIDQLLATNPRMSEVPWFRQNYLGEWVVDLDALCYKFQADRNAWDGVLPQFDPRVKGSWHHVLAIDLGYHPDPSAFAVLCYHDHDPDLYVRETWKQWRMDITDVANRVHAYERRYQKEYGVAFDALVIDGADKQAVEEMRRRHNLPLQDADKRGKADFIELLNAEFILGKIKVNVGACAQGVPDDSPKEKQRIIQSLSLVDEYAGLIWDPRKLKELNKREEHPGCANHLADAVLYGWRHCYQYLSQAVKLPPAEGTKEWYDHETSRMFEAEVEELEARKELVPKEGLGDSDNWEDWAK